MLQTTLYRSSAGDVLLVDLPKSIQEAQSSVNQLKSIEAIQYPHVSTEPAPNKNRKILDAVPTDYLLYHTDLQNILKAALVEIHQHVKATNLSWSLPRYTLTVQAGESGKIITTDQTYEKAQICNNDTLVSSRQSFPGIILSSTEAINRFPLVCDLDHAPVYNPHHQSSVIMTSDGKKFYIPPKSVFIQSSIEQAMHNFDTAQYELNGVSQDGTVSKLDLILLDPPWPNRSVRRSKAYSTAEDQSGNPFLETIPIIQNYLKTGGLVAIWITNKAAIRKQVLLEMEQSGLQLYEEWIWLKITSNGEPVTALDGLWRKPYEILLLFSSQPHDSCVRRRSIVAVPDLHSRKPSLKQLFEEYLPANYKALEIFARYLTAGWWSWGNEVLLFQEDKHWMPDLTRTSL